MMPILDGIGLLAAMKGSKDLRLIPVIMVTAASVSLARIHNIYCTLTVDQTDDQKLEGLLSGADDYIAKPFTAKHLVARTHLQLQIGKRRAELDVKFRRRTSELRVSGYLLWNQDKLIQPPFKALSERAPVG